jgi:colanic acid/amylovoran biosynthesis glycosyltransferase
MRRVNRLSGLVLNGAEQGLHAGKSDASLRPLLPCHKQLLAAEAKMRTAIRSAPPLRSPIDISNRKPAVVYLVNQYPAVTHTFIKREVQALERLGVDVARVAARPGKALVDPGDVEEGARTTYLLRQPFRLLLAAVWSLLLSPRRFAKALATTFRMMHRSDRGPFLHLFYLVEACAVASTVRAEGAAHIHAHFGTNPAEVALLASQLAGVTYSFTVHGYDEYDKPEFIKLQTKIRSAAFVIAVSQYGRSQLYRWCDSADRPKIKLVRCGIDRQFHATVAEPPCETARFLCVGRLSREKGQDILVKAAAMMAKAGHQFELVIVGDGDTRTELERLIATHRLARVVQLRGWLSSSDVRQEMIAARALVVASLAENLPVVIMEAMALQRPVVATQIAGIPELVIPRETGWLVPAGSVEALAEAMTQCLETSAAELLALGHRGCERVRRLHDVDREATSLADLFAKQMRQESAEAAVGRFRTAAP